MPPRRPIVSLLTGLALAMTASAAAYAQTPAGPYISLGSGVDILQNLQFRPSGNIVPKARDYRFDVGPSGYVSLGYGLGSGIRLEIEGDYSANHVRGVTFSTPLRAGGEVEQYGGFVNAYQDFTSPFAWAVTPYLGLGAGYQFLALDDVNAGLAGFPSRTGDESHGAFAYQGIAGLSVPLGLPGLAATAEYRMVGMLSPSPYPRDVAGEPTHASVGNIFNHELMIGLRLLFGAARAPSPAPAPQPASVPAPAAARTYLIFFDWDKADLTTRARDIIATAAAASERVQTTQIEVDGYTDLSGTAAYNKTLSLRRADAVAAELVRDGVNRSEIAITGYGETHPLVPTAQGVREPQNRRVEIILK
jgi:OOP family OmpA-OmpF porin